jgi:ankyrin repeat protein
MSGFIRHLKNQRPVSQVLRFVIHFRYEAKLHGLRCFNHIPDFAWGCQRQSKPITSTDEKVTLIMAANNGDLSQVQKLLREGADPNVHTNSGKTALHYATQSKNVSVVDALLQAGANGNAMAAGNVTPLMLSLDMAFGQPESAMALIRAGADVNVADINGDTALIIAATESSNEVFQALLEKGANPKRPR